MGVLGIMDGIVRHLCSVCGFAGCCPAVAKELVGERGDCTSFYPAAEGVKPF
jgi:hypothetical protein